MKVAPQSPMDRLGAVIISALLMTIMAGLFLPSIAADLLPRHVPSKSSAADLWPGLRDDLVIVKFVEGDAVRLRNGRLVSMTNSDLIEINTLIAEFDLQESISISIGQAAADGILTAEQAKCALRMISEADLECVGERCIIMSSPGCCPDGPPPVDCCEGMKVDVKVIPFKNADGRDGAFRLAFVEEE